MLADNLQTGSLTEAVSKTFDGDHPCPMCKAIKQGRADEQKQDQQQVKPSFKLELGPIWQTSIYTVTQPREWVPSTELHSDSNHEGPPKPPPRLVHSARLS